MRISPRHHAQHLKRSTGRANALPVFFAFDLYHSTVTRPSSPMVTVMPVCT